MNRGKLKLRILAKRKSAEVSSYARPAEESFPQTLDSFLNYVARLSVKTRRCIECRLIDSFPKNSAKTSGERVVAKFRQWLNNCKPQPQNSGNNVLAHLPARKTLSTCRWPAITNGRSHEAMTSLAVGILPTASFAA